MADKIDEKPAKDEAPKPDPLKDEVRVNVEVERETPERQTPAEPKEPSEK